MSEVFDTQIFAYSEPYLIVLAIFTASLATFLTRSLAYFFLKNRKNASWLIFLQKDSALFIMVVLVFYTLQNTKFDIYPYGMPEIFGFLSALLLQIFGKNALLSIAGATILYMFLIRFFLT